MIAENDKSAPMRVALLLFGLLNSFDQVYGPEAASPSLRDALFEADITFDVFFDTSPVEFHKVPGTYSLDDTVLKGRRLIDRVVATGKEGGRDYLIIEEDEVSIRTRIETAFHNTNCHIHFDHPDPTTWSGEGYIKRMIKTFLRRKKRITQAAIAYSQYNNFSYDALIVARPDSVIRVRGKKDKCLIPLAHLLADDISKASDTETVGVDLVKCGEKSDPGIALFKNDIFIASPLTTLISMSLIDVVDSNRSFSNSYPRPAYRCKNCKTMFNETADECRVCGCLHRIASVRNWPEYKLAEHIAHSGLRYRALGIAGDVLRT